MPTPTPGDDILQGTAQPDTISGLDGNDTISGLGADDTLNGDGGNDVIDGGTGMDTMTGGLGNDTFHVDNLGDTVVEGAGQGTDTIFASVSYNLSGREIEIFTLVGTANLHGYGNSLGQTINGNTGFNQLYGNGGNDVLNGGAGDDILDGGTGADTMAGGADQDIYYVDDAGDVVIETAANGWDAIFSSVTFSLTGVGVERLALTGIGNVDAIGNSLNNYLDGNAGANLLSGGGGEDRLRGDAGDDILFGGDSRDSLDGGTGADRMEGGPGDDSYVVDNVLDRVVEQENQGYDQLVSYVTYDLTGRNIEYFELAGGANISAYGNSKNNVLRGNPGNNTLLGLGGDDSLDGGMGADTLNGGEGQDLLFGGSGPDTFAFNTPLGPGNIDTIQSFAADDAIQLWRSTFTALNAGAALDPGAFRTGTAAQDADDRIIHNNATGALYYDSDGIGAAAQAQFATLNTQFALSAADFVIL